MPLQLAQPQRFQIKVATIITASLHVADAIQEQEGWYCSSATKGSKDVLDSSAKSSLCHVHSGWQLSRCDKISWCVTGLTESGVTAAAVVTESCVIDQLKSKVQARFKLEQRHLVEAHDSTFVRTIQSHGTLTATAELCRASARVVLVLSAHQQGKSLPPT